MADVGRSEERLDERLSRSEAADLVAKSVRTIDRVIASGELASEKIRGRRWTTRRALHRVFGVPDALLASESIVTACTLLIGFWIAACVLASHPCWFLEALELDFHSRR